MESDIADIDFDIIQQGLSNSVFIAQKSRKAAAVPQVITLPNGLPPVLDLLSQQVGNLLECPESLPIHDLTVMQRYWSREPDPKSLYHIPSCPVHTTLEMERNNTTGELLGFKEVTADNRESTAKNSFSLTRQPGPPSEAVRGSSTNFPFWPGGLDSAGKETNFEDAKELDLLTDLLRVPPGFDEGMDFEDEGYSLPFSSSHDLSVSSTSKENSHIINLANVLSGASYFELLEDKQVTPDTDSVPMEDLENLPPVAPSGVVSISDTISKDPAQEGKEKWAVSVDVSTPVTDFHKKVPQMAHKWPFDLDTFQKQAVLHLENHESVFVAAHTSAGKTVVAEYAIALALKHLTRVVYTSPIKALSNQKFRDFKVTFEDVGLLTGDVQIKPEAACLIMTTEILRSMLYNGSDVIRDLEWVIFDEVHYINDLERGVVWEEVLIMLPQHVNIILLSATVPNTMQFAEWVGGMKRKPIFVISTLKRPVPLEHYLYTGNSLKTNNELFMIIDSKKDFQTKGYNKAMDAKKARTSKAQSGFGPKGTRDYPGKGDRNVYQSIIAMLEKKEQLPVVCFTFSKKRCDENAASLSNTDLTTSSEKNAIHIFIKKSVSRLKGTDKQLPRGLLKRGIAVHHSGILPILKEVVEMLFQKGLVKFLFATETFAMGVNMPARTVLFDSIRKHDGTGMRHLNPGEYIQMAGRAGRRGLDTTGTVIILCKGDVPEMSDLYKMMLGKPTQLSSQFRLTYTMILNVLRVTELRVEDMMRRSFLEFDALKDLKENKEKAKKLQEKLLVMADVECYMCNNDLLQYYSACKILNESRRHLQRVILSHPTAVKCLSAGRIVIVTNSKHRNTLGVVLSTDTKSKKRTVKTLILCEDKKTLPEVQKSPSNVNGLHVQPVIKEDLFRPEGAGDHEILNLVADDIFAITLKTIKIDEKKIVDNYNKRQIPRFSSDPPSQSTVLATQELLRLTEDQPEGLPSIDPIKDLHIRDLDLAEQFKEKQNLELCIDQFSCLDCPTFLDHFTTLSQKMKIEEDLEHFRYLACDDSLQLIPEYHQRIAVLQKLGHINKSKALELKGRVACEMSNHELILTELIFRNILSPLQPMEIASLLSCMVFQDKRCGEPNLNETLDKGVQKIRSIALELGHIQYDCGLKIPPEDFVQQYRFGLTEVVFEWARGMPFAEITSLTDVSEGIIVRTIQRLDETCKDVRNAARIVGDPSLQQKMEEASQLIKRDIVFAASLYTQ